MPDQVGRALSTRRTQLAGELFSLGTLTAAFALFAGLSWRTWPDLLVDFGQELYVPWRMSQGDALYRDIAWVGGPLSQCWNALLFRLFGVSLTTIIVANLALLAVITGMLYGFFRRCGTRASATFVGLFFLAVFAFAQYSLIGNYNYVCPYRHEVTHGLALGLLNLCCLVHFGRTGMARWLAASGVCLGLLIAVKIEMALAAVLTSVAALLLYGWQGRRAASDTERSGQPGTIHAASTGSVRAAWWPAILMATATVPVVVTIGGLAGSLGWHGALQGTLTQYRLALDPKMSSQAGFYRALAGWDRPAENLHNMVFWSAVALAALTAGHLLEFAFGRRKRAEWMSAPLGFAIAYIGFGFVTHAEWQDVPACLPVLLLLVIGTSVHRAVAEARPGRNSWLCLAAIFSLGLLPKIILRVGWPHYGFALAMPGTLVIVHVAVRTIPDWWRERRHSGRWFQSLAVGTFAGCALSLVSYWGQVDRLKTVAVGEGGDRFYADPIYDGRTIPTIKTLAWLKAHVHADDTLIVFPNGCVLNYLLRIRNPTRFLMFNPWEFEAHGGERLVTESILRAGPDYAVVVSMDLSIHGRGNFGDFGFGEEIRKYLDESYEIVDVQVSQGGVGGPFSSTVFKRRPMARTNTELIPD